MTDPDPPLEPEAATAPAGAEPAAPRKRWWRSWKVLLTLVLLTPVVILGLYTWSALTWSYSEGTRSGYLQKLSKKGWICKTWEGELAVTTVPGVAPTLWYFTVRKDAAARQLNLAIGRRVLLFYKEHKGIPSSCFGDTSYFVDSVKIVP